MKFSQRIYLNFPKSTRHGVGSQFSPTTDITPLQAVLESRNSTTSTPLRKERDRHLSYKKEVGQTSLWNTTPISFKRRILCSWTGHADPQPSSFSTDLECFCPIPLWKPNYPPTKYTEPGSVPRSIPFLPVLHFYIQWTPSGLKPRQSFKSWLPGAFPNTPLSVRDKSFYASTIA